MGKGKLKIVLYLSAIFLIGGVVGGFVSMQFVGSPFKKGPVTIERMTERQMGRMLHELELTPEQEKKIRPIIKDISEKIRQARRESFLEFTKLHQETYERVSKQLTPEQQIRLKEMNDRQRQRVKRFISGDRKPRFSRQSPPPPPPEAASRPAKGPE